MAFVRWDYPKRVSRREAKAGSMIFKAFDPLVIWAMLTPRVLAISLWDIFPSLSARTMRRRLPKVSCSSRVKKRENRRERSGRFSTAEQRVKNSSHPGGGFFQDMKGSSEYSTREKDARPAMLFLQNRPCNVPLFMLGVQSLGVLRVRQPRGGILHQCEAG